MLGKQELRSTGRLWLTNRRLVYRANGVQFGPTTATDIEIRLAEISKVENPRAFTPSRMGRIEIHTRDGQKHEFAVDKPGEWVTTILQLHPIA